MLRPYQLQAVDQIRDAFNRGETGVMLHMATGSGKCLGRGTSVLMYSGELRPVEKIVRGDVLMGPDSEPRTVVQTTSGIGQLYRITPVKGDSWICNDVHILSLVESGTNEVHFVEAKDHINLSKSDRHAFKQWRTGVEFKTKKRLPWDTYLLGLFIGDGSSAGAAITIADRKPMILKYVNEWAIQNNLVLRKQNGRGCSTWHFSHPVGSRGWYKNPYRNMARVLTRSGEKRIPRRYLCAPRKDRLRLFAGILDTDGHLSKGGYDLCTVSNNLADDYLFLARSLGFACYKKKSIKRIKSIDFVGTYYRLSISGDLSVVPTQYKKCPVRAQKKSVLRTGISITPVGEGEYFGFELIGTDRQFLLGDFTVTHNTAIFCYIAQRMLENGKRVTVVTRGRKIVDQASQRLGREGVPHGVQMGNHPMYAPHRQVQVCSITTLYRRLHIPKSDLIIIDEAHYATAPEFHWLVRKCGNAKILGVTATPYTSLPLNHIAQSVIAPISVSEIIKQGFLVNAKYFAPSEPDLSGVRIRAGDYVEVDLEKAMGRTKLIGDIVEHYQKLAPETSALCFCVSVAHATLVAQQFRAAGVAACVLHADSPDHERDHAISELEHGPLRVICNVGVMGTGVDIPWLQTVILARPTKSLNLYLQQIGRGSRPYPEKTHFKVLDHAGNIKRHGFMDDVHPVNLDGHVTDAVLPQVKTCKECFAVYSPKQHAVCPACGKEPEVKTKELSSLVPESEAGQLVEISRTAGRIVVSQETVLEATQRLKYHLEINSTLKTSSGAPFSPWVAFYRTKSEMIGKIDEDVLVRIFRAQAMSMGFSIKRKSV